MNPILYTMIQDIINNKMRILIYKTNNNAIVVKYITNNQTNFRIKIATKKIITKENSISYINKILKNNKNLDIVINYPIQKTIKHNITILNNKHAIFILNTTFPNARGEDTNTKISKLYERIQIIILGTPKKIGYVEKYLLIQTYKNKQLVFKIKNKDLTIFNSTNKDKAMHHVVKKFI